MATTNISIIKPTNVNEQSGEISFTAASSVAEGFKVNFNGKDFKTLFLVQGGAAAGKVVIKQGNGIQGVTDIEFSVMPGKITGFTLDSGSFKNVTGTNKGKAIIIPTATDIKIAVIELP